MIIAFAIEDPKLSQRIGEYFEARSLTRVPAGGRTFAEVVAECDPSRHWLVADVDPADALRAPVRRNMFRLIVVGSAAGETFDGPDLVMTGEEPDLLEQLGGFVIDALSAFDRPEWDAYFMEIAEVVGRRANCMKRKVAAVLVRDHRIIATGYNGTPKGARNCHEGGCPRCNGLAPTGTDLDECLCNHAEENAIAQAAYHGISVRGATMYCTFSPCLRCTKLIINAGVTEVVYNARYTMNPVSLNLLAECGVTARQYATKTAGRRWTDSASRSDK